MLNKSEEKLRLYQQIIKGRRSRVNYYRCDTIVPAENRLAVAWIMAAEGMISITRRRDSGAPKPLLKIGNTELEFLSKFHHLVGKVGIVTKRPHKKTLKSKGTYTWKFRSVPGVYKFLEEILPYLPIKREVALVVMEFCKNWMKHPNKLDPQKELDFIRRTRLLNRSRHDGLPRGG